VLGRGVLFAYRFVFELARSAPISGHCRYLYDKRRIIAKR
jgi:hypothetical protein